MLQVKLVNNQLTTFTKIFAIHYMQRNILLRHTYIFGVKNFIVYKGRKLMI